MSHKPVSAQGLESLKATRLAEVNTSLLLPSVTTNSKKEHLVLEYIDNFRAQFEEVFPRRRPLLLTAKNEAGVEKFVCTTIRPTQVPYREVCAPAVGLGAWARQTHSNPSLSVGVSLVPCWCACADLRLW